MSEVARGGHGQADRLLGGKFSEQQLDELIAAGGADEESAGRARSVMANAFLGPGRFGKLFPDLPKFRPPDEALIALGAAMREVAPADPSLNLSSIPAGFTYLGQFIDHDITFDKTGGFLEIDDPGEIEQARTPTLDLDSLYGRGPRQQESPELYDAGVPHARATLRIGRTSAVPSSGGTAPGTPAVPPSLPNDLPRTGQSAIIGDERNDENIAVAQTHLAFLKFHNRLIRDLAEGNDDGGGQPLFRKARRLVRLHYQSVVLHDFLPRLVDPSAIRAAQEERRLFKFGGRPFMPLEFSVAAYRLGHSMIREQYNFNRVFADRAVEPNALTSATLGLLFRFTGGGGNAPIPSNWIVDWRRFFELDDRSLLNFARKLDTKLVPQLHELPGAHPRPELRSLAVRNLVRGSRLGLPAAQAVAEEIGIDPLPPDQIASGDDGPVLRQHGFHEQTPLWYYVLKEAELEGQGTRLGPLGSQLVAETFVGLIEGSSDSILEERDWRPIVQPAGGGDFLMADLLRYVNEVNPIG